MGRLEQFESIPLSDVAVIRYTGSGILLRPYQPSIQLRRWFTRQEQCVRQTMSTHGLVAIERTTVSKKAITAKWVQSIRFNGDGGASRWHDDGEITEDHRSSVSTLLLANTDGLWSPTGSARTLDIFDTTRLFRDKLHPSKFPGANETLKSALRPLYNILECRTDMIDLARYLEAEKGYQALYGRDAHRRPLYPEALHYMRTVRLKINFALAERGMLYVQPWNNPPMTLLINNDISDRQTMHLHCRDPLAREPRKHGGILLRKRFKGSNSGKTP